MKRTNKRKDKSLSCVLQLGKYSKYFELLKMGEIRCLKDRKSNKDSHLPVKICEEEVSDRTGRKIDFQYTKSAKM